MNKQLPSSLVSIATLTIYLVVNVGVAASHHHHHACVAADGVCADEDAAVPLQLSDADDDDDDGCIVCNVLHLAKTVPVLERFEATIGVTGTSAHAVGSIRPYPSPTFVHSRAPPLA